MKHTDKPTKTASATPEDAHAESGCTDYLQHNWDSCPENKTRKNDPNENWAMYNPEKANPRTIPAETRKDKIAYSTGPLPHPWIEKPSPQDDEIDGQPFVDENELVRRMCEEGDPRHDGELTQAFPKYPEQSINPRFAPKASAPETRPTDEDNVGSTWNWLPAKVEQAQTIPAEKPTDVLSMAQAELDQGRTCLEKYQDQYGASICFNTAYGLIETGKAQAAQLAEKPTAVEQFLYNELELGIKGSANLRRSQQRAIINLMRKAAQTAQLADACMAALSQLTEDRPEYLESDIAQLRDALAAYEAAR